MPKTHYPVDAEVVIRELRRVDPQLGRVIERVGCFPTKRARPQPPFQSLLRSIVYQQITGKAAETILGRVKTIIGGGQFPTPEQIRRATKAKLRRAGLSRQKIAAVKDLAAKTLDGTVPSLRAIRRMSEEEIVARLTQVHGIGEWSVQMFLIFRLGRPDVMPIQDLGIRKGFQLVYEHDDVPKPKIILEHAERWRPYRSIASWYLWRAADEKRVKATAVPAKKKSLPAKSRVQNER